MGMEQDITNTEFATFEDASGSPDPNDLEQYCYCVAGTVGLWMLPILGVPPEQEEAVSCAKDLGGCGFGARYS